MPRLLLAIERGLAVTFRSLGKRNLDCHCHLRIYTLVNVYVDLLVFTS